jgi:hypothetical protein
MNIEVNFEKDGLRFSAIVITSSLETHSALQEVPKEDVEVVRTVIRSGLETLTNLAIKHRKKI